MKKTGISERIVKILSNGLAGIRPKVPLRLDQLEEEAQKYIPKGPFAYISGGAGRENIVNKNHQAFLKWAIIPRVLTDISEYDTSIELFGDKHSYPFILTPVGALDLANPVGESAVARAAAAEDITMGFSSVASTPMETVASFMGDSKRWYQLYWTDSDELNHSLIRRAEACGCSALLITIDTKVLGWRTTDLNLGYSAAETFSGVAQFISDPIFQDLLEKYTPPATRPQLTFTLLKNIFKICWKAPGGFFNNLRSLKAIKTINLVSSLFSKPSLSWNDIKELKKITKLPIIVKGILHTEDAKKAVEYGLDGIVVSNHGGRQLSSCITAIEALPPIVEAVGGKIPILMDSGIRGGADVFKAIALGANAVMVGRPYVYGLGIAGEDGVREVIQNIKAELDITMQLTGCTKVSEITRDILTKVC